jgi:hypothetical protein
LTGPIEPVVTLQEISPDASLVLAWTIASPSHVAVSVCVGTWGVGDPSPTYVGSPVVVYVQLGDEMRVVKGRAVEVLPPRSFRKFFQLLTFCSVRSAFSSASLVKVKTWRGGVLTR